ncbi:phosphoribosylformylglycinamidine synthase-like, partial [Paramuricea clavata]
DGKIVLKESENEANGDMNGVEAKKAKKRDPVDIELDVVLGKMPRKEFKMNRIKPTLLPLQLDPKLTVREALERVLRLPSVASKRYLTNKVDRSVTGLIAQQQCVGPLHTPVADVAVTSLSYIGALGAATAIGEQPIKMLVDPCAGARMCLGEALTNLIFAQITELKDIKCSANWMWPAKLPGEGVALYDACRAVCDAMTSLGVAIDGGKDSLSMAARVSDETVKAPGSLVVSVYAPCPDITATVTPDLKNFEGKGSILYVKLDKEHCRLGGSALAQVFNQIGDVSPDLDEPEMLSKCFAVTQDLMSKRVISSGHDVSDGGLITTLLEMAFSGNCGISIDIKSSEIVRPNEDVNMALYLLFGEELGIVLEVLDENVNTVCQAYTEAGLICNKIGYTGIPGQEGIIKVSVNDGVVLKDKMTSLRDVWEATSFQLARLQSNPKCVVVEESNLSTRKAPPYSLSFTPSKTSLRSDEESNRPKVAVIREEGSNGDREMSASLLQVGFEVWDVNMQDICTGQVTLDKFRGIVFVGGFSFADVLGSAKGWAAVSLFNEVCQRELSVFLARKDTFSLGVCNGCQLMGLLGWVGNDSTMAESNNQQGVCFTHNESECFESRFVTVSIQSSDAVMLRGMGGSTMGVWVSHGEGRAQFKNENILNDVLDRNLAPIRYVDDDGAVTMKYPLNPNGSPSGIAALCSDDGRHLAMMPHPERCTMLWQWPWMPEEWKSLECSPWLKMFQNAFDWCNEM